MAYIRVIPEADATGTLADLYKRFGNPDGTVDNVLKVHSLNPESLQAHCALYLQCMHRPSPLSRVEREMVGVVVSRANGCEYCVEHHSRGLHRLLDPDRKELVDRLRAGDHEMLTQREAAMLVYAHKLATAPAEMNRHDVEALRGVGLTDHEILDLAQIVGYFAYANRIVQGLGATLEPDDRLGQWPKG